MESKDKRKRKRYLLMLDISCEKVMSDGALDIPMAVTVKDLSEQAISFYSAEKIDMNTKMRLRIFVSSEEEVLVEGNVVRVMPSEKEDLKYLVLIKIDTSNQEIASKIKAFLNRIDIDNLLDGLELENVLDIHLAVGYPPIIKKVNKLLTFNCEPFDEYELKNLLLGMMDEESYSKFIKSKESNFVWATSSGKRFRINLHFQRGMMEATLRNIPEKIAAPSSLGLPAVVEQLLTNKKGLILISGRTGSGKSTTLAAMIEVMNNSRNNIIICIEDPIEYLHTNKGCIIKQREVGRDTHSYYNAVKNALRQNPDVLVVGEILDMETMEAAITAAETGALVLTSMHAGTASQTFDRITSFFPSDMQEHILKRLSLILKGVITQELIPRIDDQGHVLATEITVANSALRRVIRDADWSQIPSLIQLNKSVGMHTMKDSLTVLHGKGLISEEYLNAEL